MVDTAAKEATEEYDRTDTMQGVHGVFKTFYWFPSLKSHIFNHALKKMHNLILLRADAVQ